MFLDYQFCENNQILIEKMYHMSSLFTGLMDSEVDDLNRDLDGAQNQLVITDKTKQLADILDECYENNMANDDILSRLYSAGFNRGCVFELSITNPSGIGRYLLYVYVESELELRAYAEELAAKVWSKHEEN
ncbi:hypothetical protein FDJ19_gp080 [Vibrio phage Ceto]|uniref:Uncharacterized protein n=1 Tax=Vibrio phage Ceto TaxID=2570300 RepID=A0A2H5BGG5_9CAUD|nr:hypothetical protein FDJ19_gp080 [Vibrio phage Ceto]AUG85087.1 hypothetical protein CETO_80 [Vibrio phage Ceto]